MEEEFKRYYESFDTTIKEISVKYEHSLRVSKECENIAKSINLSKDDILLAKEIGLLHDYARFTQWTEYKMFNDKNSFDHADKAEELLFNNNEIEIFNINKEHYEIIKKAIKYHNKYKIEEKLDERTLMFCNIIRDADKLDILNIFSKNIYNNVKLEGIIEKDIEKTFMNHKLIKITRKMSRSEAHLCRLAFIYDINFKYSFEYLKENSIIKIYKEFINDKSFDKYFNEIEKYIKEKLC